MRPPVIPALYISLALRNLLSDLTCFISVYHIVRWIPIFIKTFLEGKKITLIQTLLCFNLSKVRIFWLGTVTFLALSTCMTRNSSRQQRCFETETTDSHISHWAKFIVMPQRNCKLLHVVDLWGHLREVKTMTDQSANADG